MLNLWRKVVAIFAGLVCLSNLIIADFSSHSGDVELLETLVSKGILTTDEAVQIQKSMVETPIVVSSEVDKIRLGAYTQVRYYSISQEFESPNNVGDIDKYRFSMPRIVLKVFADLEADWTSIMALNLASPEVFDTYFVRKKVDGEILKGILDIGYSAPKFHMEPTNGGRLKTLDRCILNTYWGGKDMGYSASDYSSNAKQCFSGNYMGVFWQGKLPCDERFYYDFSIANAKSGYYIESEQDIGLSYWTSLGYTVSAENLELSCGINVGYTTNLSSVYDTTTGHSKKISCLGFTPYLTMQYDVIFLQSQFVMSNMKYGKILSDDKPIYTTQSGNTTPYGIMAMSGYTFDVGYLGKLEPLFRFAYLYTDGAGVAEGNVLANASSLNGYYNKAFAYYCGLNWYINSYFTKVQFCIEHLRFLDSPTGLYAKEGKVNMVGVQLQLEF